MNEKFYYTKNYIYFVFLVLILLIGFGIVHILYPHLHRSSFWNAICVIGSLFSVVYTLVFLKAKNDPAVVITDARISLRSLKFVTQKEIGFDKIISATITTGILRDSDDERINIRFKTPNNKEGVFSIYLRGIKDSERLVEILKQRIKFV